MPMECHSQWVSKLPDFHFHIACITKREQEGHSPDMYCDCVLQRWLKLLSELLEVLLVFLTRLTRIPVPLRSENQLADVRIWKKVEELGVWLEHHLLEFYQANTKTVSFTIFSTGL